MDPETPPTEPPRNSVAFQALVADLVAGQNEQVHRLFARNGAAAPTLVWRPGLYDMQHPVLRSFLRGCGGDTGRPVSDTWLDSEEFAALADWAMILEPTADGDFTFRHYGQQIMQSYRKDMRGQRVSQIGGHVGAFLLAVYHAAHKRREIVSSVHEPPRQVFVRAWRRLVVPLTRDGEDFRGFAVANVPDNDLRAGLEVLPDAVLVVSADGEICYANRPARLLFSHTRGPMPGETVADFIGSDPQLPDSPEELILSGQHHEARLMLMRGGVPMPLRLTCGGTYYRDMPFFVLSLRPD